MSSNQPSTIIHHPASLYGNTDFHHYVLPPGSLERDGGAIDRVPSSRERRGVLSVVSRLQWKRWCQMSVRFRSLSWFFVKGEHTFVQVMILFTSIMFLDAFVRAIDNRYRNIWITMYRHDRLLALPMGFKTHYHGEGIPGNHLITSKHCVCSDCSYYAESCVYMHDPGVAFICLVSMLRWKAK